MPDGEKTSAQEIADELFRKQREAAAPRLRVPANLIGVIEGLSRSTGVPMWVIAGVVQTNLTTGTSGDWSAKITPEVVARITLDLATTARTEMEQEVQGGPRRPLTQYPGTWRDLAKRVAGGDRKSWLDRFDSIVFAADPKSGKPDLTRPQLIEREATVFPTDDPRNPTVEQLATWRRQGLISPEEQRSRLIGLGFTPEDADLIITSGGVVGLTAKQKRMLEPATIYDIYDLYDKFLGRSLNPDEDAANRAERVGRPYGELLGEFMAAPEAQQWLRRAPEIQSARSWVGNLWIKYIGTAPTNDEIMGVLSGGYTPDTLERYLRSQAVGGTTRGQLRDTRTTADNYAKEFVGREADEGELNWIIENLSAKDAQGKITHGPTADQVSAFYEQLKQRSDTGDPSFAWVAAPQTWRDAQKTFQGIWARAGLMGDVDPRLVNDALRGKWTAQDITDYVNALPAPGFPQGVTIGEIDRVRSFAQTYKQHYLPGDPLTKAELTRFLGMSPEQVQGYYRQVPWDQHVDSLRRAREGVPAVEPPTTTPSTAPAVPAATASPTPIVGPAKPRQAAESPRIDEAAMDRVPLFERDYR